LRNLPEALRQLQRVLRPGEWKGRYQVVSLSNASLESLTSLCNYQGDLPEVIRLMRRALAIREVKLGPEHPDT
jgi:hypothetical protein